MYRLTVLCALWCATVLAATRAVEGNGRRVIPGSRESVKPLVEVGPLRVYNGKLAKDGTVCTIVKGYFRANTPNPRFDVTIHMTLRNGRPGLSGLGTVVQGNVTVERVIPGKQTRFELVLPQWYTPTMDGKRDPRDVPLYTVESTVSKSSGPPKLPKKLPQE